MRIENFTKEEKQQLLDSLLSERQKEQPESKSELISRIESLTGNNIEKEIESWASNQ